MRITDLLARESIALSGAPENKDAAIRGMADLMEKSGRLHDRQAYIDGLFAREEESTTAVGEGIAIPHYKGRRSPGPDWRPWLFRTVWNLIPLMDSR